MNSILADTMSGSKGKKYGKVTVTIYDNCGDPVFDADVAGYFTGDFVNEPLFATTDASGIAEIITYEQVKKPSYTSCVNSVIKEPLIYDSVEVCNSY